MKIFYMPKNINESPEEFLFSGEEIIVPDFKEEIEELKKGIKKKGYEQALDDNSKLRAYLNFIPLSDIEVLITYEVYCTDPK